MGNMKSDITRFLNKASQSPNEEKIIMISVYDIVPHPSNRYSMKDIDMLAAHIEMMGGVQEPLIVKKEMRLGKYVLISGHRRHAAILRLLDEKSEKITSPLVPTVIRSYTDEDQEKFAIVASNQHRVKTLEDRENEIEMMRPYAYRIFEEARKNGKKLGKFRDFLGEKLGVSSSEVQRIECLKKLAPELRAEINNGNLGIIPASSIASLSENEQVAIYKDAKEKYGKATGNAIKEIRKNNSIMSDPAINNVEITTSLGALQEAKKKECEFLQNRLNYLSDLYEKDQDNSEIVEHQIQIVKKILRILKSNFGGIEKIN